MLAVPIRCRSQLLTVATRYNAHAGDTVLIQCDPPSLSIVIIIKDLRQTQDKIPLLEVQFLCMMANCAPPPECWKWVEAISTETEDNKTFISGNMIDAQLWKEVPPLMSTYLDSMPMSLASASMPKHVAHICKTFINRNLECLLAQV